LSISGVYDSSLCLRAFIPIDRLLYFLSDQDEILRLDHRGGIAFYSSMTAGQSGIAHLAHLGGMIFGYLYLRGGNPWDRFKLYLDQRRLARLKRRFQVIQGRRRDDDSKPTLH
jgi:hypothetical protein